MYFGKARINTNDRIPPNQNVTTTFPVLHHGNVPYYSDLKDWSLTIFGEVKERKEYTLVQLMEMPQTKLVKDIHCVTGWSKLDADWEGVRTVDLVRETEISDNAKYVILHAEENWTTNIPIDDFLKESSMLAHSFNGKPLTPEHGFPLRAVIPHLYFWKSAKWVRGIEFSATDKPGFWEKQGYHNYGDPFKEQRFSWD